MTTWRRVVPVAALAGAGLAFVGVLASSQPIAAQAPTALPESAIRATAVSGSLPEGIDIPPEAVAAIARDLNCPLCQGYSLQDCPLTVCAQMRDLIRVKLRAGEGREAIIAGFVADYGPGVLNAPPTSGAFLIAWVLPGLALLAGLVGAFFLVRRGSRRAALRAAGAGTAGAAAPSLAMDASGTSYAARLDALVEDERGETDLEVDAAPGASAHALDGVPSPALGTAGAADADLDGGSGQGRLALGAVILVVGLLFAAFAVALLRPATAPRAGNSAPAFAVTTFDGTELALGDLAGKVVVLNFWASWCLPCAEEAADLEAIWQDYRDRGVVVVGIDYTDTERRPRDYLARHGITYPNAPDREARISRDYHISGVPETFVIGQDGQIVALPLPNGEAERIVGPVAPGGEMTAGALRAVLDRLLAEPPSS